MKLYSFRYHLIILFAFLAACDKKKTTLFVLTDPDETGIYFNNLVEETDSFNILSYEYIYNGGGVAIADFNNDGKQDIFFTGNQVPNKLYINQGDFKFKDVTDVASVNVPGRWNAGVSTVDINNDGWMDLYVCATTYPDPEKRRNMLYVNQGANEHGVPVFKELAKQYNIDFDGNSVMSAFFDYDRDGDLDLYILENQKLSNFPTNYRPRIADGSAANNDRLFRNEGDGSFKDVTLEAGILYEGFGLGLAVSDVNNDGWPDIYVSNDYVSNDLLYINQKDGTFVNKIAEYVGHQSQFSMGNDAVDINNDARPDIITLDMLPETNDRKKTTIGNKTYLTYINNEKFGYEYQYVRNMLHLNNGLEDGIKFSEVGQMAGIYQTEWSWSALAADFNNDGHKDVFITNGFPKDITDKDFANYRADVGNVASHRLLIDSIPIVKIPNYAYQNNGDLTFSDVTRQWGMDKPSFSNGAAFADLDGDGDLDYVINNINDRAFVYENTLLHPSKTEAPSKNNYLRIKLKGSANNVQAIGSKVTVMYDSGKLQFHEQNIYRGFLSSVEDFAHFGLADATTVDSILVVWPDGKVSRLGTTNANQTITVDYATAVERGPVASPSIEPWFADRTAALNINFRHEEEDKIDYNLQRTLPHKFSQNGPGIAVGDIDGDGLEDFIIGGSVQHNASIFKQKSDGTFIQMNEQDDLGKIYEDQGLLLFDADGDADLDLFVVSGSIESPDKKDYLHRLYINNGKGRFTYNKDALPEILSSGSCVRAADFDNDGDLDLFVGGRVIPGSYPLTPKSFLLVNENGKFADATANVSPGLDSLGMVTDALWSDFNNDGKIDLVVVGEFMPVVFLINENNKLTRVNNSGTDKHSGWWNSLAAGDFDADGDIDYVAGNLGLNNNFQVYEEHPLKIFAKDVDGNGSIDPVLACYARVSMTGDERKLFPIHFWDEINSQSPKFRKKFARYKQYSKVTVEELLGNDMQDAFVLEANHMASSYIENLGNDTFRVHSLPRIVQSAPINGMATGDFNRDGNLDVIMVGNNYGNEVFAGRYDAFTGSILMGDGKGSFKAVPSAESGFYVPGDAKALVKLAGANGEEIFIASQNKDKSLVFVNKKSATFVDVLPHDTHAEITYNNGRKQRIEFYYGSGYLSQSTRRLSVPAQASEIRIYQSDGKSRTVTPGAV